MQGRTRSSRILGAVIFFFLPARLAINLYIDKNKKWRTPTYTCTCAYEAFIIIKRNNIIIAHASARKQVFLSEISFIENKINLDLKSHVCA